MKGITRRVHVCTAIVATGVAVLAGATVASAQTRSERTGDGIPTGQMGTQMYNYGSYLSRGSNTGDANPITGVTASCLTSTTTECRLERLKGLFAFLQRKGVTSIELFGHAGFPAADDIAGVQAYRELLDSYGLHAAGWHGSMSESGWPERVNAAKIFGADSIGSGGVGSPGIGSYANTLATAETLNRLGKYSVEAGVGPVYIHNHTGEFDTKYVDNGELKWAWQILMERTNPRYVFAELDVFWSSDAFNDVTGTASADLINSFPTRVRMLHVKDGINVAGGEPGDSRSGSPRATGTGEVDFRPIFAAALGKVQYYHHEHDGGTTTDADTSFTNLKGINSAVVPAVLGLPTDFAATAAGALSSKTVTIRNVGDAPMDVEEVRLANSTSSRESQAQFRVQDGESPGDFSVISDGCEGTVAPGASCTVEVGFSPTSTNSRSVARLIVDSDADNATEAILLTGSSTGEAQVGVGGVVPSALSLSISPAASFGTFVPATARTYEIAMAASVVSTAGDATLSVSDPGPNAGHLTNGTSALDAALQLRAANAANADPAWLSLGAGATLLTYSGPTAGADMVTIGLRQAIAATEVLRAGSYSTTLTFSLTSTTP